MNCVGMMVQWLSWKTCDWEIVGSVCSSELLKFFNASAVVVAQMVKQLLRDTELRSSNLAIGKIYIEHLFTVIFIETTKIK